jgi:hypothetical protein
VRDTLAQLQMVYAQQAGGAAARVESPGEPGPAQPTGPGPAEPGGAQEGGPGPAQRSGRLWIPGQ